MSATLAQAIQHYVIRFASLLVAGPWFSLCTLFSSTNKTDPLKKNVTQRKNFLNFKKEKKKKKKNEIGKKRGGGGGGGGVRI
jgi:hypothetical protein